MTEPRVFADGVETFLGVRDALERVEARLAAELKVPFRGIRKCLYARTMDASLVETELVREWIRRYAAYADWVDDAQSGCEPEESSGQESESVGLKVPRCGLMLALMQRRAHPPTR